MLITIGVCNDEMIKFRLLDHVLNYNFAYVETNLFVVDSLQGILATWGVLQSNIQRIIYGP